MGDSIILPFGTKIKNKHGSKYRVLCHKPEWKGNLQETTGVWSVQCDNRGKDTGKIQVWSEETNFTNWHSLIDFKFELI